LEPAHTIVGADRDTVHLMGIHAVPREGDPAYALVCDDGQTANPKSRDAPVGDDREAGAFPKLMP
jgi:hypothetical protein